MKKTIIAAAIATVVAAPAMADVSVSGKVEQFFTDTDGSGEGFQGGTDSFVKFAASEDLGNGMKAFAHIVIDTDQVRGGTSTNMTQDEVVGLSGNFGTVQMGRFEAFVEGKLASSMSMTGQTSVEDTSATHAGRTNSGIAYVSPAMNGLTIGVGGYATTSESDDLDATEVALMYVNGPLSLKVAQQNQNDTLAAAGNDAETTTAIAASYSMGDLKVSYLRMDSDNVDTTAADDRTDNQYRVDYSMGNNKITLAHSDDETTNGADGDDITALELVHSLSKRTQVYVGMTDSDAASSDTTYFGMQHSF